MYRIIFTSFIIAVGLIYLMKTLKNIKKHNKSFKSELKNKNYQLIESLVIISLGLIGMLVKNFYHSIPVILILFTTITFIYNNNTNK